MNNHLIIICLVTLCSKCLWNGKGLQEKLRLLLNWSTLTLAKLDICVLRSFIKLNKAPTKFSEVLTKPTHCLAEILL